MEHGETFRPGDMEVPGALGLAECAGEAGDRAGAEAARGMRAEHGQHVAGDVLGQIDQHDPPPPIAAAVLHLWPVSCGVVAAPSPLLLSIDSAQLSSVYTTPCR